MQVTYATIWIAILLNGQTRTLVQHHTVFVSAISRQMTTLAPSVIMNMNIKSNSDIKSIKWTTDTLPHWKTKQKLPEALCLTSQSKKNKLRVRQ